MVTRISWMLGPESLHLNNQKFAPDEGIISQELNVLLCDEAAGPPHRHLSELPQFPIA